MIRIFIICFFSLLIIKGQVFAQWEKVYSNNTWANGAELYSHKNVLFQTGFGGSQNFILRSGDNGITWTDISSSFPYTVYYVLSYNNTVFAVTTTLGSSKYSFYASTDDGITWTEKSNIDRGSGNGAILSMASDGNNLYAVSNRRSFYKSTDEGSTWNEIIINYAGTSSILSFAVSGNYYVAVLGGAGSVVSVDGGLNWTSKNATSNIDYIYKLKNDIWGIGAGFSGIFKFNTSSNEWENNFLPGTFSMPISIGTNEAELISTFGDFLTGNRRYYSSIDLGQNWNELTTETIGLKNDILSRNAVTGNNLYYFAASWVFLNNVITYSVYRLPRQVTSVDDKIDIPSDFQLSQNYPNPFNPSTKINFSISQNEFVKLGIYNVLGEKVNDLVNEYLSAGNYSIDFNASNLSSGAYFYRLETNKNLKMKKMILTK